MIARLIWLLTAMMLCGCQGNTVAKELPANRALPTLPTVSASPCTTTPARLASAQALVVIHGVDSYTHSSRCATSGNGLQLLADPGAVAWAVYEVPNIAADYRPVRIDLEFVETSNEYWLALANYDADSWEYQEGAQSGAASILFDAGWDKYASPTDSLFIAIAEVNSSCTFQLARVTLEDTRTLAPPANLVATPFDGFARLDWDAYLDPRADTIRIYQGADENMADPAEVGIIASTAISFQVNDLINGNTYFFAITAYWNDEPLESGFSNVCQLIPVGTPVVTLSGRWPRRGNQADNCGCTENIGPPSFTDYESLQLTPRETLPNRTTPVISSDGTVYALTGDAELQCLSSDLTTLHWTFAASAQDDPGAPYFSLPHSPLLDSDGNCYFVAAPRPSGGGVPYLYCVDSAGEMAWRYELTNLPTSVDDPYPTPTITADGWIVVCHNDLGTITAINPGARTAEWDYPVNGEIHGDFALSDANHLQVPVWHTGIGIPESLRRWLSLDAATGEIVADWRDMGAPRNFQGGLSLAGDMFVFPQGQRLELIDALTAEQLDDAEFMEELSAPPARNCDSSLIYQLHPPFGFSGYSNLNILTADLLTPTPTITDLAGQSLLAATVSSQPSIDGNGTIYFPTDGGQLFRVTFDPGLPVSGTNPLVTDQGAFNRSDTYKYASFAIGVETAYIITENNVLYCIYNALD